jgi:AcrR family transcriptional regulator
MARPNNREKLLDAAERVVVEQGPDMLTLDAVAAAAGVSKGGLLYHFPSKEALIEALIDQLIVGFDRAFAGLLGDEPEGTPGRWSRAFVRLMLDRTPEALERERRASVALLATVVNRLELLDRLRAQYDTWREVIGDDGLPPGRAIAVFAALDGVWFWRLFAMPLPVGGDPQALREVLLGLTRLPVEVA